MACHSVDKQESVNKQECVPSRLGHDNSNIVYVWWLVHKFQAIQGWGSISWYSDDLGPSCSRDGDPFPGKAAKVLYTNFTWKDVVWGLWMVRQDASRVVISTTLWAIAVSLNATMMVIHGWYSNCCVSQLRRTTLLTSWILDGIMNLMCTNWLCIQFAPG